MEHRSSHVQTEWDFSLVEQFILLDKGSICNYNFFIIDITGITKNMENVLATLYWIHLLTRESREREYQGQEEITVARRENISQWGF